MKITIITPHVIMDGELTECGFDTATLELLNVAAKKGVKIIIEPHPMKMTKKEKQACRKFWEKMDSEGGLESFCRYGWDEYLTDLPPVWVAALNSFKKVWLSARFVYDFTNREG
jgi:hypothetical protein